MIGDLLSGSVGFTTVISTGVTAAVLSLVIGRNRLLSLAIAGLTGLSGGYMLLAVLADFLKLSSTDSKSIFFLFMGAIIFAPIVIASFYLPRKYLVKK